MCNFGGPTIQEQQIAGSQQELMTSLMGAFNQRFGQQSAVLQNLNNIFTPIAQAGPGQMGFTSPELSTLNATALNTAGANYAAAARAANTGIAGQNAWGGAGESGVQQAIQAGVAAQGAQQLSNAELGIENAGFAQGRANWQQALAGLGGEAAALNPGEFSGQGIQAGQAAFGSANVLQQQAQQPTQALMGGISDLSSSVSGGLAGMAASPAGASQVGSFLAGALGGL